MYEPGHWKRERRSHRDTSVTHWGRRQRWWHGNAIRRRRRGGHQQSSVETSCDCWSTGAWPNQNPINCRSTILKGLHHEWTDSLKLNHQTSIADVSSNGWTELCCFFKSCISQLTWHSFQLLHANPELQWVWSAMGLHFRSPASSDFRPLYLHVVPDSKAKTIIVQTVLNFWVCTPTTDLTKVWRYHSNTEIEPRA